MIKTGVERLEIADPSLGWGKPVGADFQEIIVQPFILLALRVLTNHSQRAASLTFQRLGFSWLGGLIARLVGIKLIYLVVSGLGFA